MVSVTKLIDLLNKPSLLYWSNNIGLKGISLKDYKSKSSLSGTCKHKEVESFLKRGIPFKEKDILIDVLKGFNIVGSEVYLKNGFIHGYCDLVLEKDGVITIVDFKSSNKIYLSHKLQLSTYKEIYKANNIAVINFNDWSFNYLNIDTCKYYEIVKRLYQVYVLLKKTNEKI